MTKRPSAAALLVPSKPACEFCVTGVPVSGQTTNRGGLAQWKSRIAMAASTARLDDTALLTGELEVRITEFSLEDSSDRDNMAKPILDAMQGVVYADDRQIKHLQAEWCDIDGQYVVRYGPLIVAAALSVGREFAWIRVFLRVARTSLL